MLKKMFFVFRLNFVNLCFSTNILSNQSCTLVTDSYNVGFLWFTYILILYIWSKETFVHTNILYWWIIPNTYDREIWWGVCATTTIWDITHFLHFHCFLREHLKTCSRSVIWRPLSYILNTYILYIFQFT